MDGTDMGPQNMHLSYIAERANRNKKMQKLDSKTEEMAPTALT